jgi:protein-disulfide isomerase
MRTNALRFVLALAALLPLAAAAQPAPASQAAPAAMPGVDTQGLAPADAQALTQLMQEGACPCDPKKSLLECIQAKNCEKATDLAQYGVKKFKEGLGTDQVREAVVKKYLDDNVTFTFDLKETPSKGAAKGRVVIVEFADFECPHCGMLSKVMPDVLHAFPNDVTLYFKNFPLGVHEHSEEAARAAWAAGRQGHFWQMHDLIFQNQATLSTDKFTAFARELGLNLQKFQADMASKEASAAVDHDRREGIDSGITGTPTLYINGKLYYDDKTADALKEYIRSQLAKLKK